ncbi:MAG: hypothetical protein AB1724_12910 [Thermodesulfobacteriota bacterium]
MGKLNENLSAVLAKIAASLGMKPSQAKHLELMEQKLSAARAGNMDQLETLKDEIRRLENRAVQKKKESDAARGDIKRMLIREIEQTFRDLDRLKGRETIITANVDRISLALAKVHELVAAQSSGIQEGQLDDIALDLQGMFGQLKASDREARDLERESYEGPERAAMDVSQRVGELEGTKETSAELSESTLQRLKELETDR